MGRPLPHARENPLTERVVVFGAGLMGKERARAVQLLRARGRPVSLVGVLDPHIKELGNLCDGLGTRPIGSLDEAWKTEPSLCVIAAPHDTSVELAKDALSRGLRVLVEKPLGRSVAEARELVAAGKPGQLWAGFNYRFFGGVKRALEDLEKNRFGKLISVNFVLGHGGSPGMEHSWKLDPARAGGGCLIDPGIHLLDLANRIGRDYSVVGATSWRGFWGTGVEEEAHVLLRSSDGFSVNLQSSLARWRNTFQMELHGTEGYGRVTGRNRTYGSQTYTFGARWGWQKAKTQRDSEILEVETDGSEVFADELDALLFRGLAGTASGPAPCSADEALKNMELLERCYHALRPVTS